MPFRLKRKVIKSGAFFEALRQISRYRRSPGSPWRRPCSPGHLRGIDFYRPLQLLWAVAYAMREFHLRHGLYPDLTKPVTFNDKIFWFKFFGELRVPYAGDKLATRELIPPHLRASTAFPSIVWQSQQAVLPDNAALPPGVYYLKANVGSGYFRRVRFPLGDEERAALEREACTWLASDYGLLHGEWWYQTYQPAVFLERSVAGDVDSISWNFFVLNGHVPQVTMFLKHADGSDSCTWLNRRFERMEHQSELPPIADYHVPEGARAMLALAEQIGAHFSAVRVDFVQGDDGQPYLCELTFAPGNALTRRHPEIDRIISEPWRFLR